jgi:hypothetical protein
MMTTTEFRTKVKVTRRSEAQKREFAAIERRARAFMVREHPDMFDADGNVVDATWLRILADLDAWAARHKVRMKETERDRDPPVPEGIAPIILARCPSQTMTTEHIRGTGGDPGFTIETSCYLKRRGLFNRCVYNCYTQYL